MPKSSQVVKEKNQDKIQMMVKKNNNNSLLEIKQKCVCNTLFKEKW